MENKLRRGTKTKRMSSTTHPFLIKLTNLTKPKLMKINVPQRYVCMMFTTNERC